MYVEYTYIYTCVYVYVCVFIVFDVFDVFDECYAPSVRAPR